MDQLSQLRQALGNAFARLKQQQDQLESMGGQQGLVRQELERQRRELSDLASALSNSQLSRVGRPEYGGARLNNERDLVYIEDIPGQRIPYDMVFSIPFGVDITSTQPATETVSQDGPFVVVGRGAVFRSELTFTQLVDGQRISFLGRSAGRYRPIQSTHDLNDAQAFQSVVGLANPGTGGPIYASPSNHSGFRTMEWDGTLEMINHGSGFHRSNVPVPSPFWASWDSNIFQLGAFDFFERGETIQIKATPHHDNNPAAGNVNAFQAGAVFPSLASQYDVHEGVLDEFDEELSEDPCVRVPQGTLEVILFGFRIVMPPGPVRMG